jgi:hypothetical protein
MRWLLRLDSNGQPPVNSRNKKRYPRFAAARMTLPARGTSLNENGSISAFAFAAICPAVAPLVASKGQEKGNVQVIDLNPIGSTLGSERLPPTETWKPAVVAIGRDPLAPRFDGQSGQPRILDEVPCRT